MAFPVKAPSHFARISTALAFAFEQFDWPVVPCSRLQTGDDEALFLDAPDEKVQSLVPECGPLAHVGEGHSLPLVAWVLGHSAPFHDISDQRSKRH